MAEGGADTLFRARTVLWLIVAGLFAFAGFLLLTAYAPEFKQQGDGGTHALSRSAVGYAGLFALEQAVNDDDAVILSRDRDNWDAAGLMIVPLSAQTDPGAVSALIEARDTADDDTMTTLFILPKWSVTPRVGKPGWVMQMGTVSPAALAPLLKAIGAVTLYENPAKTRYLNMNGRDIGARAPADPRWLRGGAEPVLTDAAGQIMLGRIAGSRRYVLADPDLLSNHGLKTLAGANAAVAILDDLRASDDAMHFDMVLSGGGGTRNLLRLMFEPPFLAFTLTLVVAGLLTGAHAFVRFGPPLIEGRAIPFGKRALADNGAMLIARAGREGRLGARYLAVVRDAAAAALGARAMTPDAIEDWLDTRPGGFATLAQAAREAQDAPAALAAAQALYRWKKDIVGDH
jgi:hypothetical protein